MDSKIDLVKLSDRGRQVFLTAKEFERWLQTPSVDFDGEKPATRLHSKQGREEILKVLNKIEHGIPT